MASEYSDEPYFISPAFFIKIINFSLCSTKMFQTFIYIENKLKTGMQRFAIQFRCALDKSECYEPQGLS